MRKEKQTNSTGKRGKIRKWLLGIGLFLLLVLAVLIGVILNPGLFYKHRTGIGRFTVYYNDTLDPAFASRLLAAESLVQKSEVYSPTFNMDICLGESAYPDIIKHFFGAGFAWGFYNKVVVRGNMDCKANKHESEWNLTQLLAHEMTHCFEFNKLGLFGSNPLAGHADWKWEGYPEFISRAGVNVPLASGITNFLKTEKAGNTWWMMLPDSTRTPLAYYKNWLMVRYCMEMKNMSFLQLLKDSTTEENVRREMIGWHHKNQ
jgi:hypothetical protein